jgi:predicted nucleic acid-binding protein
VPAGSAAALICDTGALIDYLVESAPDHRQFRNAIDRARTRYVPGLVLAEVDYFLRDERQAMQVSSNLTPRIVNGVCDNQVATIRKLLILKTERCPSGLRSTLGKRNGRVRPSDSKTPRRAFDSTTSVDNMLRDVTP